MTYATYKCDLRRMQPSVWETAIDNDFYYWLVGSAHSAHQKTALNNAFLCTKCINNLVVETEWDAAGDVRDPSCPKHDNFFIIIIILF